MAQAATDDISALDGMTQIVCQEGGGDHLCIGIHEEDPLMLCLAGEEVAYAGTPYILAELDEAAVCEMCECTMALSVRTLGRGIVCHDDLIGHTELLSLLM